MEFANALTVMSGSSKRKFYILENISTSQVVGSSSNAIVGDVIGQNSEDNNKLMTFLSILKKLEGIDVAHFTKAVKALKDDPCWRDVFLAISDDQKKDIVLNL